MANEYPNAEFVFDFFDDRKDILAQLAHFFTEFPYLMPKNLRLRLHQYRGDADKILHEVQGSGIIDKSYTQTIKKMTDSIFEENKPEDKYEKPITMATSASLLSKLRQSYGLNPFSVEKEQNLTVDVELDASLDSYITTPTFATTPTTLNPDEDRVIFHESVAP